MMKFLKQECIVLVVLIGVFASCKYAPTTVADPNPIIGSWEWSNTVGGIAGFEYTPKTEGFPATLVFSDSASILFIYLNNSPFRAYHFRQTTSNGAEYMNIYVPITYDSAFHLFQDRIIIAGKMTISHDSLRIWQDSISDGFSSLYIKK
jgi:hypothetical protein